MCISECGGLYGREYAHLDVGIYYTTEIFDPATFFLVDIKNTSKNAIAIREAATNMQPALWITGVSTNGSFTLARWGDPSIKARAKSNVDGIYKASIEWTSENNPIFRMELVSVFGPSVREENRTLDKLEPCCGKDWARRDVPLQIPEQPITGPE